MKTIPHQSHLLVVFGMLGLNMSPLVLGGVSHGTG